MEHLKYIGMGALLVLMIVVGVVVIYGMAMLIINIPILGLIVFIPFVILILWGLGRKMYDDP